MQRLGKREGKLGSIWESGHCVARGSILAATREREIQISTKADGPVANYKTTICDMSSQAEPFGRSIRSNPPLASNN